MKKDKLEAYVNVRIPKLESELSEPKDKLKIERITESGELMKLRAKLETMTKTVNHYKKDIEGYWFNTVNAQIKKNKELQAKLTEYDDTMQENVELSKEIDNLIRTGNLLHERKEKLKSENAELSAENERYRKLVKDLWNVDEADAYSQTEKLLTEFESKEGKK